MEKSFLDLVSYCLNYLESFETLRINHKELSRPLCKNEAKNICKDNIWSFFVRVWFSLSSVIYLSVHLFNASYGFHKYQKIFNPIQDGPFHGCSGMEEWGGKKDHPL